MSFLPNGSRLRSPHHLCLACPTVPFPILQFALFPRPAFRFDEILGFRC